jgi:hypothetical protein
MAEVDINIIDAIQAKRRLLWYGHVRRLRGVVVRVLTTGPKGRETSWELAPDDTIIPWSTSQSPGDEH